MYICILGCIECIGHSLMKKTISEKPVFVCSRVLGLKTTERREEKKEEKKKVKKR